MRFAPTFLTVSPGCSLRLLESPCVYDRARDELYELDREAFDFLQTLPLTADSPRVGRVEREFLDYCLNEGILVHAPECAARERPSQSPIPSLRYLLLHITTRCNLKCAHCFLGDVGPVDMPMAQAKHVMEEFDKLQGLRLLVSGGEPLLHPDFWRINELFDRFGFRSVILSNGTMLDDPDVAKRIAAHEIQVSLDGVGPSHDVLRGPGAYSRTMKALDNIAAAGIDVSVATMVHSENLDDFDELERIVNGVGAKEWNIDVPSEAGRWRQGQLPARVLDALPGIFGRAFGGGAHHSVCSDLTCGAHLCAVMADGAVCKCGFYADSPVGTVSGGLAAAWAAMPRITLGELECDCAMINECRGGCRYRAEMAGNRLGEDPVMCAANGLPRKTSRRR